MKVNDYSKDIAFAEDKDLSVKINSFIRKKLSGVGISISNVVSVTDKNLQFQGVDKILTDTNFKRLKVEEKVRRNTKNDILIELISNNNEYLKSIKGIGWGLKDYNTDLLVYYFADTNTGYVFSWKKFQSALMKNLPQWYDIAKTRKRGFGLFKAQNKRYYSLNIAIPWKNFLKAYEEAGGTII